MNKKVYIYNEESFDYDEIIQVLKDDLMVYPDGIQDDDDLLDNFIQNEYVIVEHESITDETL